jgi:predicted enzyme related to lactoylglutathione lyase
VVVGATFCVVCLGAAMAGSFNPPPLADQPSTEHHVGKVIWTELVTPDLAAAERFYTGLFGWNFHDLSSGNDHYAVALLDGERVAGIVQHVIRPGEKRQPAWLTFIAVRDVDAATRVAVSNGGKVVIAPRTFDSRGRQAILADPQGAVFAVLASFSGDPGDYLAAPGAWIWSSLMARDAGTDAAFYETVFGYDVFDLESEAGQEHVILSTDDYARASVNSMPADSARRHPHWLNFVRVTDAAAAATRVITLGGSVLVAPRVDRHGGKVAVLADPMGAPFGVMEWTDADSKEEPK